MGAGAAASGFALADSDTPAATKAGAGLNLARGADSLAGSPVTGAMGSYAGPALAGAAAIPAIAQIAGSDLSNKRKAAESAKVATDVGISLIPVVGQFYGAARAAQALGQHMQTSGSPQVRAGGRAIDYAVEPGGAKAFWNAILGRPGPMFGAEGPAKALTLDMMGPVGVVSRAVGFDPTFGVLDSGPRSKGGKFRAELNALVNSKVKPLGNLDVEGKFEMSPEEHAKFSDQAKQYAETLGAVLTGATSKRGNRDYSIQASNVLLNNLGEDVLTKGPEALKALNLSPADAFGLVAKDWTGDSNQLANLARGINMLFGRDPEMDLDL